jgi:hypothetical protein
MMKITNTAVETIDINLDKCTEILHLIFKASEQPNHIHEPLQVWNDEILRVECLIDDMRGLLMSDLMD